MTSMPGAGPSLARHRDGQAFADRVQGRLGPVGYMQFVQDAADVFCVGQIRKKYLFLRSGWLMD